MVKNFHAIVRFDSQGELVCFCAYEDYLRGECGCREKYNCPEAMIDITVLPQSRPSERGLKKMTKVTKEANQAFKKVAEETNRIKQGVSKLEKAIKGTRFRI
jgi:hypothetical protein